MSVSRRQAIRLGAATGTAAAAAAAAAPASASARAAALPAGRRGGEISDAALAGSLPGFASRYAHVNGVRLHYVTGGRGAPLVLLPGYPETWWEYRKIMPALAARYQVIAVDLRGMGGSAKPAGGYDKKTMARDIFELARQDSISGRDRDSYARAYDDPAAIRASNGWYQARPRTSPTWPPTPSSAPRSWPYTPTPPSKAPRPDRRPQRHRHRHHPPWKSRTPATTSPKTSPARLPVR